MQQPRVGAASGQVHFGHAFGKVGDAAHTRPAGLRRLLLPDQGLAVFHPRRFAAAVGIAEGRLAFADANQFTVEFAELLAAGFRVFPRRHGFAERFLRLRVKVFKTLFLEAQKLLFPPFAHRFNQFQVAVADEIIERVGFAVFLAHEQQRHVGRQDAGSGNDAQHFVAHLRRKPVAEQAVAHLVVVLRKHHKPVAREPVGGGAEGFLAVFGIRAVVHENLPESLVQVVQFAEVGVVMPPVAGGQRMDGVVEIIQPLARKPVAVLFHRADDLRVVQVRLAHQQVAALVFLPELFGFLGQFAQEMLGPRIPDMVRGIEPQAVNMEFVEPHQGILDEEMAHLVAVRIVKVERLAPDRGGFLGEIRPVMVKMIAFRANVIVHHVQENRDAAPVAGIHKCFQTRCAAIRMLHRVRKHAIVAPVARAGKLRHRHDFNGRDAQFLQVVQLLNHAIKRAFCGECAHVQLVQHQFVHGQAAPTRVRPAEIQTGDL